MRYDSGDDAFVGIDAGTTGATVAVFDRSGAELACGYCEYPCLHPHPGWVEQDMEAVWQGMLAASRQALENAPALRSRIRSVGLASQRGSFVLLDETLRPLAPAVVWNDSRAKDIEDAIATKIDRQRYREITGTPLSASFALAKMAWLKRHRPDMWACTRWICNGQEYILRRLGAERLETDPASLTLNGMLDIGRLDWSEEICRAAGIDPELLPPVGAPGVQVGTLSAEAAEAMGLPVGIAICRGGGDQQCAAVGAGVIRQGMAEVTLGTAGMMVAHLDDPALVKGPAPYLGGHAIAGKWDLEGGTFAIGAALRWWRDHFAQVEVEAGARLGISPYELMVAQAAGAPPGSRGVLFHPFFAGQVTPHYDATARGGFFGLGLHHDRACLVRALFEGCAFEVRMMVDGVCRDLEGGITELRLTGGGAKSALFSQIHADVQGRPIGLLRNPECTALGAAILGAVGAGLFSGVDQAIGAMVHVDRVVEPRPEVRALYDDLFDVFRAAYEGLAGAGWYGRLYEVQNRRF
jgi:xylulokinase